MAKSTEQLIAQLSEGLQPVKTLRPPLQRALVWLAVIVALGMAAVLTFSSPTVFARRTLDEREWVELVSTLLTGVLGVVAAFYLSLPDRSARWAWLPWPSFGLWLTTSGYGCYQLWSTADGSRWEVGEGFRCLSFILGVSLPLAIFLYGMLRRARPLTPVRVAFTGGLGVAGLSAFLLQFFHPFDVTVLDLSLHLAAVMLVVAGGSLFAKPALAGGGK